MSHTPPTSPKQLVCPITWLPHVQFSAAPCCFLTLRPQHLPQQHIIQAGHSKEFGRKRPGLNLRRSGTA